MRDLFIGIVAAKSKNLPELPDKTYLYMQDMVAWAKRQGFEAWLFSDKKQPLSGPKITKYIERKNSEQKKSPKGSHGLYNRRCIFIYFCGHGYSRGRYEQFWILNNGENTWQDRIDVMSMKEVVEKYQPEHIRLFGDACAEPRDIQGGSSPVFPDPSNLPPPKNIRTDLFFASSKGATTLANRNGPVFSQVVRKAILNSPIPVDAEDAVVSNYEGQRTVTNRSLRAYIEPRFKNFVASLNGNAVPWMIPDVDHPGCIYRQEPGGLLGNTDQPLVVSRPTHNSSAQAESFKGAASPDKNGLGSFSLLDEYLDQISPDFESLYERMPTELANPFRLRYQITPARVEDQQGTKMVQIADAYALVPEFSGFKTVISVGEIDEGDSNFKLKLRLSNQTGRTRFEKSGGLLLSCITTGTGNFDEIKAIVGQAREHLYQDPLAPIALAYLYEASGKRQSINELFSRLAERSGEVAIDIALLAKLPISYDNENRTLVAGNTPLSTQLPILNRGWSRLFDCATAPIFLPLQQLRYSLGADAHAVFRQQKDVRIIKSWLARYFGDLPDPFQEVPHTH